MVKDKVSEAENKIDRFKIIGGILNATYSCLIGGASLLIFLILAILLREGDNNLLDFINFEDLFVFIVIPTLGVGYIMAIWYLWYKRTKKAYIVFILVPTILWILMEGAYFVSSF